MALWATYQNWVVPDSLLVLHQAKWEGSFVPIAGGKWWHLPGMFRVGQSQAKGWNFNVMALTSVALDKLFPLSVGV